MELIVIALGGNAICKRNEALTVENQYNNIDATAKLIANLAGKYQVIIVHGNGPQVGLLALQNAAYKELAPYPLDILVAQTQGMLGYMISQNLQKFKQVKKVITLLTKVEVDKNDPSFNNPTKFIGPVYAPEDEAKLVKQYGWTFKPDGKYIRRVVPSPKPQTIVELDVIKTLLADDTILICNGGGGVPVIKEQTGYQGIEAVIDKDHSAAKLATELGADHLMILTDTDFVYANWGTPQQKAYHKVKPDDLRSLAKEDGSIGPKVQSAIDFVEQTNNTAYIGSLNDLEKLLAGTTGTIISAKAK
ncbi:carbamate kinase [Orbus hercynius]|uniref:Carbamate kinase n=1 Tax=Orbus hercynius TaxID=593135 RepID=A0A495RJB8_9GAMM|nr:carbamate kinase [Orbus hercynius]RKS87469.1 carbamate kinase [Orbus hercynius]